MLRSVFCAHEHPHVVRPPCAHYIHIGACLTVLARLTARPCPTLRLTVCLCLSYRLLPSGRLFVPF